MSEQEIAIRHYRYVAFKDGREFVHECDGVDCRVGEEARAAGVSSVPYAEVDSAVEWRTR